MSPAMHHVVLGGSGFVGRHLARALARRGDTVTAVDRVPFPDPSLAVDPILCDLVRAGPRRMDEIVARADVVHHCAWTTVPSAANANPLEDLRDNLGLTVGLLEALKRRGGGRLVFLSSGGTVYGQPRGLPIPEEHPLEPVTPYGASKVAAEAYLRVYRGLHGVDARVLRVANLYGAGQDPRRGQGAVTTFVHRALAGEAIVIWGDGTIVRDYLHVADLIPAMLAAAEAPRADVMPVHNVGSGHGHTLVEVVRHIERRLATPLAVTFAPGRPFDVPANVLAIDRAGRDLGWHPRLDLSAGIARTVRDLRADRGRAFSR